MADSKLTKQNGAMPHSGDCVTDKAPSAPEPATQVVPQAPRGPPLWKIHELPVPIRTFPLPSFYPSNPLSLLHVAYAWLQQLLSTPREPAVVYEGTWSPSTRSVVITDPKSIRALWEQGFYGKGHLSRSEPNWLKREQSRKGAHDDHVAEVFTNKRREERIQMKWDRAKKEQEVIQRTRFEEARIAPVGPSELLALPNSPEELDALIYASAPMQENAGRNGHTKRPSTPQSNSIPINDDLTDGCQPLKRRKSVRFSPKVESTTFQFFDPPSPSQTMLANGNGKTPDGILTNGALRDHSPVLPPEPAILEVVPEILASTAPELGEVLVDKEHLQLTLEEAFWLSFSLGVLEVKDKQTGTSLSVKSLLELSRRYSYFPPRAGHLQPDDPFLIHYAVYHHFRSLGWVTRPGIKFGCDWLLYHRGPAFNHAEFAVIVLPSYSDSYWRAQGRDVTDRSWHWLHLVNRVQSTALKTLVLVYVDVPAPAASEQDIPTLLKQYKIREVMIKRWLINRNRD